ncbi:MAG: baseplate J/gp47 family protein [Planctomycetota bacterium]
MTIQCRDNDLRLVRHAKAIGVNGIESVEVDYSRKQIVCRLYEHCDVSKTSLQLVDIESFLIVDTPTFNVCESASALQFHLPSQIQEGKTYELRIRSTEDTNEVPDGWDPRLSSAEFTYNATPNTETDFLPVEPKHTPRFETPSINYLAKDYATFRQLVLDRMAITMPGWQETHIADLGMTLVELLAFVADRLSYEQDAVATESYLGTARQRSSVRRHARLADYRMHEGCNARSFLHLQVRGESSFDPKDLIFTTEFPAGLQLPEGPVAIDRIPEEAWKYVVPFEAMPRVREDWRLRPEQVKSERNLILRFQALDSPRAAVAPCPNKPHAGIDSATLRKKLEKLPGWALPTLALSPPPPSPSSVLHWIDDVNEWLEEVDILTEAVQSDEGDLYKLIEPLVPRIAHLSIPERNRVLFDAALSEEISPANLTDRIPLYEAHNEIHFYTWDESQCWLEQGATTATLVDYDDRAEATSRAPCAASPSDLPACTRKLCGLSIGDFLVFEEVVGPLTGSTSDADHSKRHVIRITNINQKSDPVKDCTGCERPILEIEWDRRDALPFPLCISSKRPPPFCDAVRNVSVARGNLFLVDHGRSLDRIPLGKAVQSVQRQVDCGSAWNPPRIETTLVPFRPVIDQTDLCYSQALVENGPASESLVQDLSKSHPSIRLIAIPSADGIEPISMTPDLLGSDDGDGLRQIWSRLSESEQIVLENMLRPDEAVELRDLIRGFGPQRPAGSRKERLRQLLGRLLTEGTWESNFDLMDSGPEARQFVVEMDERRRAHIRFGDGEHGRALESGTQFYAEMRAGGGTRGNVGAEQITRVVIRQNAFLTVNQVRNPLPARGGTDPEPIEQAKLLAPHAYKKDQPRALIASDYGRLAQAKFSDRIQSIYASSRHAGTFEWIDVAIDPKGSEIDSSKLVQEVQAYLDRVRKIGHLVRVTLQTTVPVDLQMNVTINPHYPRQLVHGAIASRLSNQTLDNGLLGFFHPDRMVLGRSIHSNEIIHEVLQVDGVVKAQVTGLGRLGECDESQDHQSVPTNASAIPSSATGGGQWTEFELPLGPLEVATLDRNSKCGGRLTLSLEGGR